MRHRGICIWILFLSVNARQVLSQTVGAAQAGSSSVPGQLLRVPHPIYPPDAKARGVTGAIVLQVTVDQSGHPSKLDVVSGPMPLRAAAINAVRQWVYKPYVLNAVPTQYDILITVDFELVRNGTGPGGSTVGNIILRQSVSEASKPVTSVAEGFCSSAKAGESGYYTRVSGGAMQGLLLKKVEPAYPAGEGWGAVAVELCVNSAGVVEHAQAFDGPLGLRGAAANAVSQWVYRPFLLKGMAVAVETTVTLSQGRN